MKNLAGDEFTRDGIFNGRLILSQPRHGYRFSLDAPLLAAFARPRAGDCLVDLGAGCGVAGLGAAYLTRPGLSRLTLVELQPRLAYLAGRNSRDLDGLLPQKIEVKVLRANWENLGPGDLGGAADYIISNPPYRKSGSGRLNPHDEARLARHESGQGLAGLIKGISRMLVRKGRAALVFPAVRLTELLTALSREELNPIRLRPVQSQAGRPAKLILVEAVKGSRAGLILEPPLTLYQEPLEAQNRGRPAYTMEASVFLRI